MRGEIQVFHLFGSVKGRMVDIRWWQSACKSLLQPVRPDGTFSALLSVAGRALGEICGGRESAHPRAATEAVLA